MKNLFNFNVLFMIVLIIGIIYNPKNPVLFVLLTFEMLILIVHGKKNFLKR